MENRGVEYMNLNRFAGRWNTVGRIFQTELTPEIKISGTDTYEWLPGNFFLLHIADVLVGDEKNYTLEIIGFDKSLAQYTMQYYDNYGDSGFMVAAVDNDTWTFVGGSLRFKGGFSNNYLQFSDIWEQSADGDEWDEFMEIKLIKDDE